MASKEEKIKLANQLQKLADILAKEVDSGGAAYTYSSNPYSYTYGTDDIIDPIIMEEDSAIEDEDLIPMEEDSIEPIMEDEDIMADDAGDALKEHEQVVNKLRAETDKLKSVLGKKAAATKGEFNAIEVAASLRDLASRIEEQYNAGLKMNRFQS